MIVGGTTMMPRRGSILSPPRKPRESDGCQWESEPCAATSCQGVGHDRCCAIEQTAHYPRRERGEIRAIIRIAAGIDVVFSICRYSAAVQTSRRLSSCQEIAMIRDVMVWLDGGASDEIRLAAVADMARGPRGRGGGGFC